MSRPCCWRRLSSRSATRLQRFVIGPAAHGDERNMLLVTLGLAVLIENALLYAFRADTRTIDLPYASTRSISASPSSRFRA